MSALWELRQTDDLVTIRTPAVRIVFRRAEDRWIHEIGPVEGPPSIATLESGSGPEASARVLSPVYQEVQHHAFDDDDHRVRLLLTGLMDKHHFSAVLTVSTNDDGTSVDFDVADRCRADVTSLAATYDVRLAAGDLEAVDASSARWTDPNGGDDWTITAAEPARLAIAERGPRAIQAQVLATLAPPGVFTHRLRYGWSLASRSGRTR